MAKYRVELRQLCYTYVTVEIPDDEDDPINAAIDMAHDMAPGELSAVESGHRQLTDQGLSWSRELSESCIQDAIDLPPVGNPEPVGDDDDSDW